MKEKKEKKLKFSSTGNMSENFRFHPSSFYIDTRGSYVSPKNILKKSSLKYERSQSPSKKSEQRFSKYFH